MSLKQSIDQKLIEASTKSVFCFLLDCQHDQLQQEE